MRRGFRHAAADFHVAAAMPHYADYAAAATCRVISRFLYDYGCRHDAHATISDAAAALIDTMLISPRRLRRFDFFADSQDAARCLPMPIHAYRLLRAHAAISPRSAPAQR